MFDIRDHSSRATILLEADGVERLRLTDGFRQLRIDLAEGSFLSGPIGLRFLVEDDRRLPAQLLALRQFRSLRRKSEFSRSLHPPEPKAKRWIDQIRALDGIAAGASTREVAEVLRVDLWSRSRWRERSDFLRSGVRRLIKTARENAAGGYLRLLH